MTPRNEANRKATGPYVGIIGLGYVGLPLVREFIQGGARVLGFDINSKMVAVINRGRSPIKHISHESMAQTVQSGRFRATDDMTKLSRPDTLIICVPTPLTKNREPDLQYI